MPDLLDKIDQIESTEKESSAMQQKMERLNEMVLRQKKIIDDQNTLIEQQKQKLRSMVDVPDDVYELRDLIGTQRALLNEKESELEHAKAMLIQTQRELQLTTNQMIPTQQKLEDTFAQLGQVKAEFAEKKSELLLKNEKIKALENKVIELQAFTDKFQDEQVKLLTDMESKHTNVYQSKIDSYLKQIEELRLDKMDAVEKVKEEYSQKIQDLKEHYINERGDLKQEIAKMESILLDSKLISTEKSSEAKDIASRFKEVVDKQESLIKKIEEVNEEKRMVEGDINRLNQVIDNLSSWKEENKHKIAYYDKLSILMEQEPLFKAFLIVNQVGEISLEDLRSALGVPIVMVQKHVQKLQEIDLLKTTETGKITVNKDEDT